MSTQEELINPVDIVRSDLLTTSAKDYKRLGKAIRKAARGRTLGDILDKGEHLDADRSSIHIVTVGPDNSRIVTNLHVERKILTIEVSDSSTGGNSVFGAYDLPSQSAVGRATNSDPDAIASIPLDHLDILARTQAKLIG